MKKIIFLSLAIICLSISSGCAITHEFGPYFGKVVDAETKEPIEGAVVFMECTTVTGTMAGATSHYADAKEVLTDEKGEFNIELRATTYRAGHLWKYDPYFIIFKPGYGVFPGHQDSNVNLLKKDTSHIFPANTYVTISLPRLNTKKDRLRNLHYLFIHSEIPIAKWPQLFQSRNIESLNLGLKQY